jgi:hypothetical protein
MHEAYIIEGTLRHQDNINIAKSRYGNTFMGKIIYTKYFNDDENIKTLVCNKDTSLVLGKPRYDDNFLEGKEYMIKLVSQPPFGLYNIKIINY